MANQQLDPSAPSDVITVVVRHHDLVADGVVGLELERTDAAQFPHWDPGAHIDLVLPDGTERQYSLCGDPANRSRWQLGVLLEPNGRNGSRQVHSDIEVGSVLQVRGPRNHFRWVAGVRYQFIAGGIGITPIVPMLRAAQAAGAEWSLAYSGRSLSTMAFHRELTAAYGARVRLFPADTGARVDLVQLCAEQAPDTLVFCCGPARLLDAVDALDWPNGPARTERFFALDPGAREPNESFEIELGLSGLTLTVPPEQTIVEVVEAAGILVISSCREGTCGTCETPVISGEVDHRDSVLTPDEQADNAVMMICVSRSLCPRLVLEL